MGRTDGFIPFPEGIPEGYEVKHKLTRLILLYKINDFYKFSVKVNVGNRGVLVA